MKLMRCAAPWSLFAVLALASCAKPGSVKPEPQINPTSEVTGKPLIRSGNSGADAGTPVAAGGNVISAKLLTDPADIVYTNADDPDEMIPELDGVLANVKRGPWEESETVAKQRAVREGKPMLIWFTDSRSSPMCKALSQELFSTTEFGEWATENLVRLRVDAMISDDPKITQIDEKLQRQYGIVRYNAELKKRYKVMGYPSLVMVNPSGEVVGTYRGYKRGEAELLWGKFKHAAAVAQESYKGWRAGLEKKGYRDWKGTRDQKVFAKLVSYQKGNLVLIEPDGQRLRTKESSLSAGDQKWIQEQKNLRKIQ